MKPSALLRLGSTLLLVLATSLTLRGDEKTDPPPPGRGLFMSLAATVKDAKVRVSFYQSTRFWQRAKEHALDPALVLRIYRKEVPALFYGVDYEEILNDIDVAGAKLVWDGPLKPINERKYEFTDATVEIGHTYVYWVSSNLGDHPTGPKAVRVRDPATFWSYAEIERRMEALAAAYPALVRKETVGRTVLGRPIDALLVGNPDRCVALVGSMHAGEAGPELILGALEILLRDHPDALRSVGIVAIPIVNIDSRERLAQGYPYYLRKNAAGVDLNRNFKPLWGEVSLMYGLVSSDPDSDTYFGPAPESEPEVQAVARVMAQTRPLAVFSFHCLAAIAGTDLVRSAASANDAAYTAKCEQVSKTYVESAIGPTPGPHSHLVCTGGSLATLMWSTYGTPAYDIEGPEIPPYGDRTPPEMLTRYQALHARGILGTLKAFAR